MQESKNDGFCSTIKEDLRVLNVSNTNLWTMLTCFWSRPGFRAVFLFRLASYLNGKGKCGKLVSILFININLMLHGCEIRPEAIIGPGLLLPHPSGINIGWTMIGHHATLMQGVTFGLRRMADDSVNHTDRPRVGNHVFISIGAVVVGRITIGDHAVIGPNTVVLNDVPAHSCAEGLPAKITTRQQEPAT